MRSFFKNLSRYLASRNDRRFSESLRNITGQYPENLDLYRLAVSHTSVAKESSGGIKNSYERLEYLGDAILGAVVAEFLFKKFPFKDEGFLTEIRSRIVNRESLNNLGRKIGLNKLVEVNAGRTQLKLTHKSLYGDALEALVGAVYLDKGFLNCRRFILTRLIYPHFDLNDLVENNQNFKSILIEWAQRENKDIKFVIIKEIGGKHNKEFTAEVLVAEEVLGTGSGFSKKKAEQSAAEKACKELKLK